MKSSPAIKKKKFFIAALKAALLQGREMRGLDNAQLTLTEFTGLVTVGSRNLLFCLKVQGYSQQKKEMCRYTIKKHAQCNSAFSWPSHYRPILI